MDKDTQAVAEVAFDATGRVMALEAIVTRLTASHAQRDPDGVAARMIDDTEGVVASVIDGLPAGTEGLAELIAPYLRHYLQRADQLRDGTAG